MSNLNIAMSQAAAAGLELDGSWDLSYAYYDPPEGLAWNISTAVYTENFAAGTEDTQPAGLFFKPDGTKMYIVGSTNDSVYEYNLSTPWGVSTAVYLQLKSVAAQDTGPEGLFFKPDGTKMYVVGVTNDSVYEYNLSTAWDITTASFLQLFSVAAQDTSPEGIFFKPDGTKMYVLGDSGNDVNEYNLSTAWDITTATFLQLFSVTAQDTSPQGLFFKPDGTKMYVLGDSGDDVNEYDLSTAWDVSTASFLQLFSVASQDILPRGIFFKPDGSTMYVLGDSGNDVNTYLLGGFSVEAQNSTPSGNFFKPDGTKLYVVGSFGTDEVYEYNLSTAWDLSTASYLQLFSVAAQDTDPKGVSFKPDGTKMYVIGLWADKVSEYNLSIPWDISTAVYLRDFSVTAQETQPAGLFFRPDGAKMYVTGNTGDDVNEYNLSTVWNVSTASYSRAFSVTAQETSTTGVFFKPDGTKMYVIGTVGDDVNEYNLSTPWNISTASFSQLFSVASQQTTSRGIFFKPDGTKMYVVGSTPGQVFTYTLLNQA